MTTASEAQRREEEVPSDAGSETLHGQVRTRVSSVAPDFPPSSHPVTERIRLRARTLAAMLDRPGSLAHAQPPTFRQARDRCHECAGHFQAGLLRWPRFAWGYLHLLVIMPALYLAVWVTESPARFIVTALIIAAICYWS
jgi:hypothetical protein